MKFSKNNIENWRSPENDFCLVFWFMVFGYWVVQKKLVCFFSMKRPNAFKWCSIYFCTMDGFFRILKKVLSELICTRLYFYFVLVNALNYLQCATRIVSKLLNPIGNGSKLITCGYTDRTAVLSNKDLSVDSYHWLVFFTNLYHSVGISRKFWNVSLIQWKKLQGAEYLLQTKILALSICNYAGPNYVKR